MLHIFLVCPLGITELIWKPSKYPTIKTALTHPMATSKEELPWQDLSEGQDECEVGMVRETLQETSTASCFGSTSREQMDIEYEKGKIG